MRFRATEVVSLLVAVIALVGTLANSFYAYSNRNRELDIELVKLGVAILRADPNKETQTKGAREWAITVIESILGQHTSFSSRHMGGMEGLSRPQEPI
jgi:hypothetical protein